MARGWREDIAEDEAQRQRIANSCQWIALVDPLGRGLLDDIPWVKPHVAPRGAAPRLLQVVEPWGKVCGGAEEGLA